MRESEEAALIRAGDAVRHAPFTLVFDTAMVFGRPGQKRMLVLRGSDATAVPFDSLRGCVVDAMTRCGFGRPRVSGAPHITLQYLDRTFDDPVEPIAIEPLVWRVEAFTLVRSHIGRTRHETIGHWPLRGA